MDEVLHQAKGYFALAMIIVGAVGLVVFSASCALWEWGVLGW